MRASSRTLSSSEVHLFTPPAIHGAALSSSSSPSSSPMILRLRASAKSTSTPAPATPSTLAPSTRPHPGGAAPDTPSPTLPSTPTNHSPTPTPTPAFQLWSHARRSNSRQQTPLLSPGSHRPLTFRNVRLAWSILACSAWELFGLLWTIHPVRILFFLLLNLVRGLFPAARAFSQSLLLDQVHLAVSNRTILPRLGWLLALEFCRMLTEAIFEYFASGNERAVQQSIRFRVEYLQMETRLRLDMPALANPEVQDLLTEADLFARSFNGIGGALGLLSPFDLLRSLTTLGTEIIGHGYLLYTLIQGSHQDSHGLTTAQWFLIGSALVPSGISALNWVWTWAVSTIGVNDDMDQSADWPHALYSPKEAETAERHERMRRLAYDESFKSEIMLFGLAKWILKTWVETRELLLSAQSDHGGPGGRMGAPMLPRRKLFGVVDTSIAVQFMHDSVRELTLTLQAIPLIFQLSTTTLGNATLYRTSIQTLVQALQTLSRTFQLTYQSIFLMGAFHAALTLQPTMEPAPEERQPYVTATNADGKRKGMKIEARNLWFTYPGETEPAIKGLNLKVEPGEVVAIVGKNGGGKSTLMHVLLRLFNPELPQTSLLINDLPASVYSPSEIHAHSTAVFQNFNKLANGSVRENVGIGAVDSMYDDVAIEEALKQGGAYDFVHQLKDGVETRLESSGFGAGSSMAPGGYRTPQRQQRADASRQQDRPHYKTSLSGGQWQRIALSRSFMRAHSDLLVLDEASSQLDAHAQNDVFARLLSPNSPESTRGQRTVIFITHRLSTVRLADKVAFFDDGRIKEFGTHEELLSIEDGGYKALYGAFASAGDAGM